MNNPSNVYTNVTMSVNGVRPVPVQTFTEEHTWVNAEDAARELDKAYDVLFDAYTYFITTDQANATRHLAKETRPSPLTIRVRTATEEARRAADRFRCKHD
jgi:hypothetical protein